MPFSFNPFTSNFDLVPVASTGANTALSNLTATNINQNLLFDTDYTYDVGSSTKHANQVWTHILGSNSDLQIYGGTVSLTGNAATLNITTAGTSSFPINLHTGNSPGAGESSGAVSILSGDADNNTGNISISTGTPSSGTRGSVSIDGTAVSLIGQMSAEISNLNNTSWGSDIPSLVIDGNTAEAVAASGAGIIFSDNDTTNYLLFATQDHASATGTSGVYIFSGANTGSTGEIDISSGTVSGAATSGGIALHTGDANGAGGSSAGLFMRTGNADQATGGVVLSSGNSTSDITNNVTISSGNAGTASGAIVLSTGAAGTDAGSISLTTGSAGGTRGAVSLDGESVNFVHDNGYIGTNSDDQSAWGADIPGLLFDATSGAPAAASGAGIFLKGTGNHSLALLTTDQTGATGSSTIYASTGYTNGTGSTGSVDILSGNATGASGNSGQMTLITGGSTNGNSGRIILQTGGAGGNSGNIEITTQSAGATRGNLVINVASILVPQTITAGGVTGDQTIDTISGTVNFAAAATTITVTCSQCTTSSLVFATVRTDDATATIKNVVPSSGSFVINLAAAATAETSVGFFVLN